MYCKTIPYKFTYLLFELQYTFVLHCPTMKEIKSESLNFRTTKRMRTFLENLSDKNDRSVSYVINDLLIQFLMKPPDSIPIKKNTK